MKVTYKIGKSKNWRESAIVGIIGAFLCLVAGVLCTLMPVLFGILGVVMLIAGLGGYMKRADDGN